MSHKKLFWLFGPALLLMLGLCPGCGKAPTNPDPELQTSDARLQTSGSPVLKLHWLGRKRLAANPQAADLLAVWNLPESVRLEKQTLDKLALAPWRFLKSDAATNAAPLTLLRPLLDDLVSEETHLTIHQATNQPPTVRLAVRLDAGRAALWQSNLPSIFRSLLPTSDFRPQTSGFRLQTSDFRLDLSRTNDWTVLTLSHGATGAFAAPTISSNWLAADLDLAWLLPKLGVKGSPPPGWPNVTLRFSSEGGNVRTRAEFAFGNPLNLVLPPWNVPTNLIKDPLITFAGIRGLGGWLGTTAFWKNLDSNAPPDQLFSWAATGMPQLTFWAAPHVNSRDLVNRLSERLIRDGNPWLAAKAMGHFQRDPEHEGVTWADCAFMAAYLHFRAETGGEFVTGGLFPDTKTPGLFPAGLDSALHTSPDLIAYDWELTGERVNSLLYVGQLFRVIFNRGQLPPDSASIPWLKAIVPELGNSVTSLKYSAPDRITASRQSNLGLTAFELHLLVEWLESPRFPQGLHSLLVPGVLPSLP